MSRSGPVILAFDCGMSVTGYSTIEPRDGTYVIGRFGSIKASSQVSKVCFRDVVEKFGKSTIALSYLIEQVAQLVEEVKPDFIVVEDIYLNPRLPTAYASLLQWICAVKMMLHAKFNMTLHKVPTKVAKLAISGTGSADKDNVMDAILSREDIIFKQKKQSITINEHEADSIAVGIGFACGIPSM